MKKKHDVCKLLVQLDKPTPVLKSIRNCANRAHDVGDHSWHQIYHAIAVTCCMVPPGDFNETPSELVAYFHGVLNALGVETY